MRDPGDPFAASAWRHERGGLWDVGPHAIAQLCAALGRIVSVVAHRGPGDLVVVRLAHEEGAISELVVAADVAPGAVRSVPLRLVGEAGEAHSPVLEWSELVADAHDRALGILTEPGAGTPLADARFGEHLTTVLDAAERSVRSRRVEPVPV
jgi:predicted dehydrogenase